MCAITGFLKVGPTTPEQDNRIFDILTELFKESISRGKDAAGFAFLDSADQIKYAKAPVTGVELVAHESWNKLKLANPKIAICHTRYGTKGSEFDNNNNHPQIIRESNEDQLALIHNGCISSDDTVRRENPGLNWKAEVDTEVIPVLIQDNIMSQVEEPSQITKEVIIKAIQKSTKELSGSFACAMLNKNTPKVLYLFKHSNPIVLAYSKELNTIFFASTSDIINKGFNVGGENIEDIFGIFTAFRDGYVEYDMPENEIFALDISKDNLEILKDKFKAKEYKWTGTTYTAGEYNYGGQGHMFDDGDDWYSGHAAKEYGRRNLNKGNKSKIGFE